MQHQYYSGSMQMWDIPRDSYPDHPLGLPLISKRAIEDDWLCKGLRRKDDKRLESGKSAFVYQLMKKWTRPPNPSSDDRSDEVLQPRGEPSSSLHSQHLDTQDNQTTRTTLHDSTPFVPFPESSKYDLRRNPLKRTLREPKPQESATTAGLSPLTSMSTPSDHPSPGRSEVDKSDVGDILNLSSDEDSEDEKPPRKMRRTSRRSKPVNYKEDAEPREERRLSGRKEKKATPKKMEYDVGWITELKNLPPVPSDFVYAEMPAAALLYDCMLNNKEKKLSPETPLYHTGHLCRFTSCPTFKHKDQNGRLVEHGEKKPLKDMTGTDSKPVFARHFRTHFDKTVGYIWSCPTCKAMDIRPDGSKRHFETCMPNGSDAEIKEVKMGFRKNLFLFLEDGTGYDFVTKQRTTLEEHWQKF